MRSTMLFLGMAAALLALGAAFAGTTTEPAAPTPPAVPAPAAASPATPAPAPVLTLTLSSAEAVYGDRIVARGALDPVPATPGERVVLEVDGGSGAWTAVAEGALDGYGAFTIELEAAVAGAVRARAPESNAVSEPVALAVTPIVNTRAGRATAFRSGKLRVTVRPAWYSGRLRAVVRQSGDEVATLSRRVRGGRVTLTVPTPGVGPFWVELTLPPSDGLSERTLGAKVVARGRALRLGSVGPDVRGLRARLAQLRFYVPRPSATFGEELFDSVIAFQKAYGLSRAGAVDAATWRKLARAQPLTPRHRGPSPHIEVNKTRQILLVVERGEVVRVLPTSTGATGNTPEGRHQIRWKAPATTTWLGSGILYRTLTFVGNSFAIHGWYSVPTYPASHGCVRIPIWMADWLYNRSPVGETVYVY